MAVASINETTYVKLLARALPRTIKTDKENERIIAELEKLDTCGRPLTPEEENLAELMTILVRQYEDSKYPLGHAAPVEALRVLMEDRSLRQRDLILVFGSSSVASDVINGKRSISKTHVDSRSTSAFPSACSFDKQLIVKADERYDAHLARLKQKSVQRKKKERK